MRLFQTVSKLCVCPRLFGAKLLKTSCSFSYNRKMLIGEYKVTILNKCQRVHSLFIGTISTKTYHICYVAALEPTTNDTLGRDNIRRSIMLLSSFIVAVLVVFVISLVSFPLSRVRDFHPSRFILASIARHTPGLFVSKQAS